MIDTFTHRIDLLLWGGRNNYSVDWQIGEVVHLHHQHEDDPEKIKNWAFQSVSDYGLFWSPQTPLPHESALNSLIESHLDIAHTGLSEGLGNVWPSLVMIKQDWSMTNAPSESPSTSWRMSLSSCLVRRSLILDLNGIDPGFLSLDSAGLDFGFRALRTGAIVEHRPELANQLTADKAPSLPLQDLYTFVLRHYSEGWTKYLLARRVLANFNIHKELKAFKAAHSACEHNKRQDPKPVNYNAIEGEVYPSKGNKVSVIIPTLGRYDYISGALNSLKIQTVQPYEVIVVDQNPVSQRQPQVYDSFEDLNLQVIWQDACGQCLARNTGLAASSGDYVFFFDDDSIAQPDLIEKHLLAVVSSPYDVSTGVAVPPPPTDYVLPESHQYPRIAQTFDTGNSLLSLDLAKKLGGLDRNYDFGPGADADFGTRLYLSGYRILHNPLAVRIHFKAPSGGLRVHGAHRYNTDAGIFAPFPPVTRSYYGLRFLNPRQRKETTFLSFFLSKFPQHLRNHPSFDWRMFISFVKFAFSLVFYPIKLHRSLSQAQRLMKKGPQLVDFETRKENSS